MRTVATHLALLFQLALMLGAPVRAQQMSLQEFGQADGLQNLAVTSLVQDAEGDVWAGTENGAYRFDGARFERVGSEQGIFAVNSLVADGPRVWIVADGSLWLWQNGHLERIVADAQPLRVSGVPQAIAPDGTGGVWVIDQSRLWRLTRNPGGRWQQSDVAGRSENDSTTSVYADVSGDVWSGCGQSICRRHAGTIEAWGVDRGVPAERWHWLLRSSDGSLWARGAAHVLQLEPGAATFSDRTDGRDAADPRGNYPLVEDAQHRIVGAARGVLERWNGQTWDRFDTAAGLPAGGRLRALLKDREGGLWLGMMGAGALRWRGYGQWENWSVASGLPHTAVWRFARAGPRDHVALYAATGAGVARLDVGAARFRPLATMADQETEALASDSKGALWAGTSHGRLSRLSAVGTAGAQSTSIELPGSTAVNDIYTQRSGDVWVHTDAGMLHRSPGASDDTPMPFVATGQGDGGDFNVGCEDRDGVMWFASPGGISSYDAGRWERRTGFAKASGALACLRDGTLAASADSAGVHILTIAGSTLHDRDVTPPALNGRAILAMQEDRRGWLWVSTDAGVAVWNREHWRLLDHDRGLVWNDTSGNALYEDRDGSMWIGTSRGASHILSPDSLFAPVTGRVAIRSITRGDLQLAPDRPFRLPWSRDQLDIDLTIPVFRDRDALVVQYRLLGLDDRWRQVNHSEVNLTGLQAGRYRFEARAIDKEIGTASPGTGVDFDIDPPWWRSGSALAAMVVSTLGMVYAVYRWRISVMTRRSRQLTTLVYERTRELEESREQLRELATKDGLTGLWNRRALMDILERDAGRCQRDNTPLAIVLADIDHFKQVNDTHGHPAGDSVLREFADRLAAGLRPYDAVGRYGGEEFVIVLPGLDITQPEHRARIAAIHASIAAAPMGVGTVTCSFGVTGTNPTAPSDVARLIAMADRALYAAKRNGRDRIEWDGGEVIASPSALAGPTAASHPHN